VPMTTSTHGAFALDQALILLGQTPGHHDPQLRVRVLERLEVPEVAVELVVGVRGWPRVQHDHARAEAAWVGVMPSGRPSTPPMRSESCSFIWQPKVRIRYLGP